MTATDPFDGFESDLDERTVSDAVFEVPLPDGASLPEGDLDRRYLVYAGLLDMLAEATATSLAPEPAAGRLAEVHSRIQGVVPTLRFRLHEEGQRAEQGELVARMRGREVSLTRDWMVPRLRDDIELYQGRIEGLRAALGGEAE